MLLQSSDLAPTKNTSVCGQVLTCLPGVRDRGVK